MSAASIIPFTVEHTEIEGLKILRMKQVTDERGTVREFYRESSLPARRPPGGQAGARQAGAPGARHPGLRLPR
jgi:dTDP-4-dehydrorhamnose 3,5-epimerase-like enzyme